MAVLKLSQIASGGAPAAGDQAVGVTGGTTDNLFTFTQVATTVFNTVGLTIGSAKINSGSNNKILYDNSAVVGEATVAGSLTLSGGTLSVTAGGIASPTTSVQFNNGGQFGGDSGFTYAGAGQVTHALGTIATNNKALTITGTFNAAGTTFDAPLFMNITNTASALGSALVDIQQGGVSNLMLFNKTASTVSPMLVVANAANPTTTAFQIYNTVDTPNNPTNYERGVFDWTTTANVLSVGTQNGGSGSARNMNLILPNTLSVVLSGSTCFILENLNWGFKLGSNLSMGWSNTANDATQTRDTGISRPAATVVEINNGSGGTGPGVILPRKATFATLPASPIVGMIANISDGLAGNCGDGSCTTFGTNVTGGTGALALNLWYNGTHWTLIGK